jgi:hypothetical protein
MNFYFLRRALHVKKVVTQESNTIKASDFYLYWGRASRRRQPLNPNKCAFMWRIRNQQQIFFIKQLRFSISIRTTKDKWSYRGKLLRVGWKGFYLQRRHFHHRTLRYHPSPSPLNPALSAAAINKRVLNSC